MRWFLASPSSLLRHKEPFYNRRSFPLFLPNINFCTLLSLILLLIPHCLFRVLEKEDFLPNRGGCISKPPRTSPVPPGRWAWHLDEPGGWTPGIDKKMADVRHSNGGTFRSKKTPSRTTACGHCRAYVAATLGAWRISHFFHHPPETTPSAT